MLSGVVVLAAAHALSCPMHASIQILVFDMPRPCMPRGAEGDGLCPTVRQLAPAADALLPADSTPAEVVQFKRRVARAGAVLAEGGHVAGQPVPGPGCAAGLQLATPLRPCSDASTAAGADCDS